MELERQAIAQWEEEQAFSILGVLEFFSGDIQGYGEQLIVMVNPIATNADADLLKLRKLNVFKIDYFETWYFANLDRYPQVKQYID